MNQMSRSHVAPSPIADAYDRAGFFFPYDVIGEAEAAEILADLEAGEAELADPGRRAELSMLRSYPSRLLPSFDTVTCVHSLMGTEDLERTEMALPGQK